MPLVPTPSKVFLTKGVGRHKYKLSSFELALRDAGIEKSNLVRVSSILPPGCKIIPKKQGLARLTPGEITFVVLAEISTNEPNRLIAASVGVAVPADPTQHGYLSEHHCYGMTEEDVSDYTEDLAATMLASTLGIEYDDEIHWDTRKELWKMHGKIVRTTNSTQSAEGDKDGLWTTVVAAAVFVN